MLAAETAVLIELKPIGIVFLVLLRVVVSLLALTARQCDLNSHIGTSYEYRKIFASLMTRIISHKK